MRTKELPDGYVEVTFTWARHHGNCEDCGLPAAFYNVNAYGVGRHQRLCCVCAANAASDGSAIRRIDQG